MNDPYHRAIAVLIGITISVMIAGKMLERNQPPPSVGGEMK